MSKSTTPTTAFCFTFACVQILTLIKTYALAFYGPLLDIVRLSLSLTNSLTALVETSWLTGRSNDNLLQADIVAFNNVVFLYFCILSFCLSVFRPSCLSVSTERGEKHWRILPNVRHSTNRGRKGTRVSERADWDILQWCSVGNIDVCNLLLPFCYFTSLSLQNEEKSIGASFRMWDTQPIEAETGDGFCKGADWESQFGTSSIIALILKILILEFWFQPSLQGNKMNVAPDQTIILGL